MDADIQQRVESVVAAFGKGAIVVVGNDHDLATGKGRNCSFDAFMGLEH